MPNRSTRSKSGNPEAATIVFRPGAELGHLLGELADEWSLSRGEVAKRLVALAVHKLDLEFVTHIEELMELEYGGVNFDTACHQVHVVISEKQKSRNRLLTPEERLAAANEHVEMRRMISGVAKRAERTKLTIRLERR